MKFETKPPLLFASCSSTHQPEWHGSCAFCIVVRVAGWTWYVSPRYSLLIASVGPSTSVRPFSIVRKPSMWSNDRFSIIRTTMWSILRRLSSACAIAAPRQETVSLRSIPACLWPGTEQ